MSRCLFDPKPTPMAPPCRAPDGQLQRSNSRTGGGFAEKYTRAPSMQRLEGGKGPEGGLHYQDIWTVVSVKCRHRTRGKDQCLLRALRVTHQPQPGGMRPGGGGEGGDQNASESYEGQSPVLPGMHRPGVGLRRMRVVRSALSEADTGTTPQPLGR